MTDEIPTSTISPELRIKELEEALKQETERVLKVYDAFSAQEQEITTLKAEIEVLEKEIVDREIEKEGGRVAQGGGVQHRARRQGGTIRGSTSKRWRRRRR